MHNPGEFLRYDIDPHTKIPEYDLSARLLSIGLRPEDGTPSTGIRKRLQAVLDRCGPTQTFFSGCGDDDDQGQNLPQGSKSAARTTGRLVLNAPDRESMACIEPLTRGLRMETLDVGFDFHPVHYGRLFKFLKTSVYCRDAGNGGRGPGLAVVPGGDVDTGRFVRLIVTRGDRCLKPGRFYALADLGRLVPADVLEAVEFRWFDADAFRRHQARNKKPAAVAEAVNEVVGRIFTASLNAAEDVIRKMTTETNIHPHPFTPQFKARAAACRFL